ncbi:hypothetical protein NP590_16510 [Methylomonas sp. SURF-2]|uniref:PEP-CTERM protein-sorting domain-containing protein n=1 Tax=Methylomonas subterranea TaxID=2952225 RepID=A0ABT1TJS1_9GAMM|nr:hypothetical protein [Methylomonas sp. SURF-2]MCQ8105716.1 hypothetical protein [Methylomonas sp. SURF-2]
MIHHRHTESIAPVFRRWAAHVLLSGAALFSVPASALTIDNFELGGFSLVADQFNDPFSVETGLATSEVLGGERRAQVVQNGGIGTISATLLSGNLGDDGIAIDMLASPNSNLGVSGFLQLTYGSGMNLHENLTADGSSAFLVTLGSVTQPTNMHIGIYSLINSSIIGQLAMKTVSAAGTYAFAFSDFGAMPNAFDDILRIDLYIGGPLVTNGASFSLLDFRTGGGEPTATVAEPGSLPLAGIGILWLALQARARRRRLAKLFRRWLIPPRTV